MAEWMIKEFQEEKDKKNAKNRAEYLANQKRIAENAKYKDEQRKERLKEMQIQNSIKTARKEEEMEKRYEEKKIKDAQEVEKRDYARRLKESNELWHYHQAMTDIKNRNEKFINKKKKYSTPKIKNDRLKKNKTQKYRMFEKYGKLRKAHTRRKLSATPRAETRAASPSPSPAPRPRTFISLSQSPEPRSSAPKSATRSAPAPRTPAPRSPSPRSPAPGSPAPRSPAPRSPSSGGRRTQRSR